MKPATTAGKTPAEHLRPRDLSRSGLLSYLDSPDRRCHSPCNESMTEKNPLVPRNEVAEAFISIRTLPRLALSIVVRSRPSRGATRSAIRLPKGRKLQ
jgi:hypothetical protein